MVTLVVMPENLHPRRGFAEGRRSDTLHLVRSGETETEAELDEDARALQKRDRAFLFRLGLRLLVALLFGVWVALSLAEADVGGCAARGFENVSE